MDNFDYEIENIDNLLAEELGGLIDARRLNGWDYYCTERVHVDGRENRLALFRRERKLEPEPDSR